MRLLCSKHDARLQTILRDMLRFIIAHYISDVDKRHTSKIKQIVAGICTCGDITLVNCALQVSQQLGSNVVRTARIGYSNIWSYLVFWVGSALQAQLMYFAFDNLFMYCIIFLTCSGRWYGCARAPQASSQTRQRLKNPWCTFTCQRRPPTFGDLQT